MFIDTIPDTISRIVVSSKPVHHASAVASEGVPQRLSMQYKKADGQCGSNVPVAEAILTTRCRPSQYWLAYPGLFTYGSGSQKQPGESGLTTFWFSRIYRSYRSRLCDYAKRIVRCSDQAEDLVQDVFTSIWERRDSWSPSRPIVPYLYRAVRNKAFDVLRHQRMAAHHEEQLQNDLQEPLRPDEDVQFGELFTAVGHAVNALPHRSRQAYVLTSEGGLTYAEAAEVMKISVKTVEKHLSRSHSSLRGALNDFVL
jgi:RNA polymerase sigma-70 factor, ECF subfamily